MKNNSKKMTAVDFEKIFGEKLSPYVKRKIRNYNFRYRLPTPIERDKLILTNLEILFDKEIDNAGVKRKKHWEKGWSENLIKYNKLTTIKNLKPMYFEKYKCIRWNQDYIIPLSKDFEENSLSIIQDWLFDKYLRKVKNIYEFGCGTGHNLLRIRNVNQKANLWGLDWAESSQKLINTIKQTHIDNNIHSYNFDFFKPDNSFKLDKDAIVITIASLEQTGKNFKLFINYLLKNKPKLVIHIEPIYELLDKNNLLDYLSIKYFQKRNYLSGLLNYLQKLEVQKKIKIIKAQRTYIGSLFIEGYSVIVWKII